MIIVFGFFFLFAVVWMVISVVDDVLDYLAAKSEEDN